MKCCKEKIEVWSPNIKVGDTYMQYPVKLERHFVCCGQETKNLFINEKQVYDHGLASCSSRQLCAPPSYHKWQEYGHSFLLVFNPLSWACHKDHRLFVDGVDVGTGREFSDYWRYRGRLALICGVVFLLIGVGGIVLTALQGLAYLWLPLNYICWGVLLTFIGVAVVYRFRKNSMSWNETMPNEQTAICGYSSTYVV